jgi:hypothetical protein
LCRALYRRKSIDRRRRHTVAVLRVLLAERQPMVRAGLAMLLGSEPDIETVDQAGDGQQAVDSSPRHRPDVVVMDVRMPVLDGVRGDRRDRRGGHLTASGAPGPGAGADHVPRGRGGVRALARRCFRVPAEGRRAGRPASAVRAVAAGGAWLDRRWPGT